jgi:stringent starvation protein B
MSMTSSKPYLIRALYEWILDNDLTPYIAVDALSPSVHVPQQYVNKDGQIILNIAPRAVESINLSNDAIAFSARFGGVSTDIFVPCFAVLGIYARENGKGMMFEKEAEPPPIDPSPPKHGGTSQEKRPSLRVVK